MIRTAGAYRSLPLVTPPPPVPRSEVPLPLVAPDGVLALPPPALARLLPWVESDTPLARRESVAGLPPVASPPRFAAALPAVFAVPPPPGAAFALPGG
ncbi:hypothetical protein GCM10009078_40810 [Cupriavidus gilardii]